jgi:hypothetical protein
MPVRKTESRIPTGLQPSDLGEAVAAADNKSVLISQIARPLVQGRENLFTVMVMDAALAQQVQTFDWHAEEGAAVTIASQVTQFGELAYIPSAIGPLSIRVRLMGAGNAQLGEITMALEIIAVSAALETMIGAARNEPGPTISHPDVARELVNDLDPYYHDLPLGGTANADFSKYVFAAIHDGLLRRDAAGRRSHLDRLAAALNDNNGQFALEAATGAGVSGLRLGLLAMVMPAGAGSAPPAMGWTEFPKPNAKRVEAEDVHLRALSALSEPVRIDLFNAARFPKANIRFAALAFEELRDRYFPGTDFNSVITGQGGVRSRVIIEHYREGPILRD